MNTLLDKLKEYNKGHFAFHMPGHMRNRETKGGEYLRELRCDIDITEIDGFDDLYHPEGILKESMDIAGQIWGTQGSFFLVNGSTSGNMAAIYSLTKPNSKVLIAKNCHKSVYHAVEAFSLSSDYIYPEFNDELGIYLSVKPSEVKRALELNSDTDVVVITSPTFEGVLSDITEIANIVHSYGAKLIVDEAHGGHLGLSEEFGHSAIGQGADIVTQSFHKTLLSLTQTAVLHISDSKLYPAVRKSLEMFQSSSPSYVLMASMDSCVRLLQKNREELFKNWDDCLSYIYDNASNLNHIKLLYNLRDSLSKDAYSIDKSKVVMMTHGCNISGFQLMKILRDEFNIELELASFNHATAYTGLGLNMDMAKHLLNALKELDLRLEPQVKTPIILGKIVNERKITSREATSSEGVSVGLKDSIGKISQEYVWAYPPGIPILTPGEVISREILEIFMEYSKKNVDLRFSKSQKNGKIYIVKL